MENNVSDMIKDPLYPVAILIEGQHKITPIKGILGDDIRINADENGTLIMFPFKEKKMVLNWLKRTYKAVARADEPSKDDIDKKPMLYDSMGKIAKSE